MCAPTSTTSPGGRPCMSSRSWRRASTGVSRSSCATARGAPTSSAAPSPISPRASASTTTSRLRAASTRPAASSSSSGACTVQPCAAQACAREAQLADPPLMTRVAPGRMGMGPSLAPRPFPSRCLQACPAFRVSSGAWTARTATSRRAWPGVAQQGQMALARRRRATRRGTHAHAPQYKRRISLQPCTLRAPRAGEGVSVLAVRTTRVRSRGRARTRARGLSLGRSRHQGPGANPQWQIVRDVWWNLLHSLSITPPCPSRNDAARTDNRHSWQVAACVRGALRHCPKPVKSEHHETQSAPPCRRRRRHRPRLSTHA
mmetsp:Transcript_8674/g.23864  ORF Transcript_8674/g.23864 Transcript_8674/m.23864 type:complete len:317 (+) Transcript_8674:623-1573(+)